LRLDDHIRAIGADGYFELTVRAVGLLCWIGEDVETVRPKTSFHYDVLAEE